MQSCYSTTYLKKQIPVPKIQSVFDLACSLTDLHDDREDHEVFALAFGLNRHCQVVDFISLLEEMINYSQRNKTSANLKGLLNGQKLNQNLISHNDEGYYMSLDPLINLLEKNGAPYCRIYIEKYITDLKKAGMLFEVFVEHKDVLKKVIEALPDECKIKEKYNLHQGINDSSSMGLIGAVILGIIGLKFYRPLLFAAGGLAIASTGGRVTSEIIEHKLAEEELGKAVVLAEDRIISTIVKPIQNPKLFSFHKAFRILRLFSSTNKESIS